MTIKRTPEEFCVDEVLADEVARAVSSRPGRFALYRLGKRGLTTPDAVRRLAEKLGCPAEAVAVGGLKDKQAVTSQHVTARMDTAAGARPRVQGEQWKAERLGYVDRSMDGAAIAGNVFEIVVSGLDERACELMDGAAELLEVTGNAAEERSVLEQREEASVTQAAPPVRSVPVRASSAPVRSVPVRASSQPGRTGDSGRRLRFVNYFGRQRFGTVRHGRGFLARHLVRGQFEQAFRLAVAAQTAADTPADRRRKQAITACWGRWPEALRRMGPGPERAAIQRLAEGGDFREAFAALPYFTQQINVEAYQSHLWNATASELIGHRCPADRVWEAGGEEEEAAAGGLAVMRFVAAGAVGPELAGLVVPLAGPQTKLRPPWSHALRAVMERERLRLSELPIPGLRRPFFGEAERTLFADAEGFAISPPQAERKGQLRRTLRFRLPRGAYATVLLAAMGQ